MSDKMRLWWAHLNEKSPRYMDWKLILGSDDVPLLTPADLQATLEGEGKADVYLLDVQSMDDEAVGLLVETVARKMSADPQAVQAQIDKDGHFPIRAEDVIVSFSLRAFI